MNETIIPLDLGGVNAYLVKSGPNFLLADTGGHLVLDKTFDGRRERLEAALRANGVTPENLKLLVLTHGDNDHAANAAWIKETYGVRVAMHTLDRKLVEAPSLEDLMASFHYRSPVYRLVFALLHKTIAQVTEKTLLDFTPFTPDLLLEDGDRLDDYGFAAQIVASPGHTDGSICILTDGGGLIAGDTFVCQKKPAVAPNALDFAKLKQSAARLKKLPVKTVYPGHGRPFAFAE